MSRQNEQKTNNPIPEFPADKFGYVPIGSVEINPRNAHMHSKQQIKKLARAIKQFGLIVALVIDENGVLLAGHGRLQAAQPLGMKLVPVVRVEHLNEAQKRAFMLFDNKITELAGWDRAQLAKEFDELGLLLPKFELDITDTGFEVGEVDIILSDHAEIPPPRGNDIGAEKIPAVPKRATTRLGDNWMLGPHTIVCGDARSSPVLDLLMGVERARMVFLDPPYNVKIRGHVQGRGAVKHDEFAFASGEMSKTEFIAFLKACLTQATRVCCDGALNYICMDWRHMGELLTAGEACYSQLLNVLVWVKTNAGQGSLYRSQHELIFLYKVGEAPHCNAVELGRYGRNRSNVMNYAGANTFKAGRAEELASHPTPKPVALVADAMRDCTAKGDIVLELFLGSGTTLIAAERVGRICRGVEFEPKYVDVAVRRWQNMTRQDAICAVTGRTFDEIAAERGTEVDVV